MIFVYDENEDSLDIYFEGSKRSVERLLELFAATVLDIAALPTIEKPVFGVERMWSPDIDLVLAPGSAVLDVRIKRLVFAVVGELRRTNTIKRRAS